MAEYYKTHSRYVLKSKNKTLENGDAVYEKDFTTFTNKFDLTEPQTFSEGNFIVVTNNENSKDVIFDTGEFDSTVYTLENISSIISSGKTQIEELKLNPDNRNFSTFGYFGSLYEMMRSTFYYVIDYFPAGLYINIGSTSTGSTEYKIPISNIYNPFGIEYSLTNVNESEVSNTLRYIGTSFENYIVEKEINGVKIQQPITGYTYDSTGYTISIFTETPLGGNLLIRPKDEIVEEFYNSKNGAFYRALLNRYSNPIYTSTWYTLIDDENGLHYEHKSFTWPSYDGYNPDMSSGDYAVFFTNIRASIDTSDQYISDNLYRSLTHDAIKDHDYLEHSENEIDDIPVGKIEKVLKIYGRNFDDLKAYIDGISTINTVTYDKNGNIPDILVENNLNKLGWINNSINPTLNYTENTSNGLYEGYKKNILLKDVERELLRRITINSSHLFKRKGTINGLKSLIKMFGLKSSWFDINEYIGVTNPLNSEEMTNIRILNEQLHSADEIAQENNSYIGLPIQELEDGRGIPKINTYYEDQYFQMKGGWDKETGTGSKKLGSWSDYSTQISGNKIPNTTLGNNPHTGNDNYDFGQSYIEVYKNCFSNELKNNTEGYATNQYINHGFNISQIKAITKVVEDGETNNKNVNLKNLDLGLNVSKIEESLRYVGLNDNEYVISNYINDTVIPYVYQMIPSTSIFKFYPYTTDNRSLSLHVYTNTEVCTFSVTRSLSGSTDTVMDRVKEGSTSLIKNGSDITIKIESYDSENYEIDGFYNLTTNSSLIEKVDTYTFNDNTLNSIAIEIRLRRKFNVTVSSNDINLGSVNIYGSNIISGNTGGTFYITKDVQGVYVSASTISSGYMFDGWYENDALVTKNTVYALPAIRSNRNIVAKFVKPTFNVTNNMFLSYFVNDVNTIESTTTAGSFIGSGSYEYGDTITMKVTPNNGYLINKIRFKNIDGTSYSAPVTFVSGSSESYLTSKQVTNDFVIECEFIYEMYNITVSENNIIYGEAIGGNTNINRGDIITITSTPNTGYEFVNWSENGIIISTDSTYTFNVYKTSNIVANFAKS